MIFVALQQVAEGNTTNLAPEQQVVRLEKENQWVHVLITNDAFTVSRLFPCHSFGRPG
jgi:hypothetical protein